MKNLYSNKTEKNYIKTASSKHRKELGQFFTPFQIAYFMSEWIAETNKSEISLLDPAAGFGIFSRALEKFIEDNKLNIKVKHHLKEIDNNITKQLETTLKPLNGGVHISNEDFMKTTWKSTYDAIIANPPYYKHHYVQNKEEIRLEANHQTGRDFSVQTNIYCWFLVKSMNLLKKNGRLAFIVPTEFLNSNYGVKIKEYLIDSNLVTHLINIDFTETVFDDALTTSVIILIENKRDTDEAINFYTVNDVDKLINLKNFLNNGNGKKHKVSELNPKTKWRNYFNGNLKGIKKENLIPFSTFPH